MGFSISSMYDESNITHNEPWKNGLFVPPYGGKLKYGNSLRFLYLSYSTMAKNLGNKYWSRK